MFVGHARNESKSSSRLAIAPIEKSLNDGLMFCYELWCSRDERCGLLKMREIWLICKVFAIWIDEAMGIDEMKLFFGTSLCVLF